MLRFIFFVGVFCFLNPFGSSFSTPLPTHWQTSSLSDKNAVFIKNASLNSMNKLLTKRIKNRKQRIKILKAVATVAQHYTLNPKLVLAIIQTESSFNPRAVSKTGAVGLMQIMPFWKKVIGSPKDNLTDIATNVRYGCKILSHYIKLEHGNLWRALERYNGSLGFYEYPERIYTTLKTQRDI